MRRPESDWCLRCRGWFRRRHGFGLDKRWCTRACWLASPQRRLLRPASPRLFQAGSCHECGILFIIEVTNRSETKSIGGRFCCEPCRRRHKRRQYRSNQRARICPGCLIRTASYSRGLTRTIGMLCTVCQKLAIYTCLSKARFVDKASAFAQPEKQRAYPCLLCDGWHRSSASRSFGAIDKTVMRRLAPLYDRLVLDPQIKAALISCWRLRRGAGA